MIYDFGFDENVHDIGQRSTEAITHLVQTVKQEIKTRLAALPDGKALVVNIGEIHNSPNNIIAEAHLIHELLAENIAFETAFELEPERIKKTLAQNLGVKKPDAIINKMHRFGRFDEFEMRNLIVNINPDETPLSSMLLFSKIQENNITIHHSDAPRIYGKKLSNGELSTYIDTSKHTVREAITHAQKIMGKSTTTWQKIIDAVTPQRPILCESDDGMTARNLFTIDRFKSITQAMTGDKRLLLAFNGSAHIRRTGTHESTQNAYTIPNLSRSANFEYFAVDLGASEQTQYHPLIDDRTFKAPAIPINLPAGSRLLGTFNSGIDALARIKAEERQIEALDLQWLEPYKAKILDMYEERYTAFKNDLRSFISTPAP